MEILGRGIQFLLMGICLLIKLVMDIFWKLYTFFIVIALFLIILATAAGTNSLKILWSFLSIGLQVLVAGILVDFANDGIGKIFGNILNEKQEDKDIFEKYGKHFSYQYGRKEYGSRKSDYSRNSGRSENKDYSNYSGYSEYREYKSYSQTEDSTVKKYKEYLKYFGINTEIKITSEIIKKAYKAKIKEVHPDRNPGKDTTAETAKVNEIKEFLDMNLEYYLMKRGL